jgi:ribonuclease BN (tRNA processing enzyme)
MKKYDFIFLGTCAADFNCAKLEGELKNQFDKNTRRASCAIFNGKYMLDCGPHAIDAIAIAGVPLADITDLFMTHLHSDHFNAENVQKIASAKQTPLRIWVRADAKLPELSNIEIHRMPDCEELAVNEALKVTGLRANHDQHSAPQFLLFDMEGDKILYATDGAWFINTSYYHLRDAKVKLLVLDCTTGDYEGDYRMGEHNSIPMIKVMLPSLKTWGVIDENTETYISHLAQSLHAPHEETEKICASFGVKVAYDGLRVQV